MAQILDKQGLQHYANKMCNADNRKVGSKSLPTALNEIDTAIDGFKTLFETEYGTPVNMELENNKNVFSIGTGTNINKKDDVENSFTDIELSGNSLVNLWAKRNSSANLNDVVNNTNNEYVGIIKAGSDCGFTSHISNIKSDTYTVIFDLKTDSTLAKPKIMFFDYGGLANAQSTTLSTAIPNTGWNTYVLTKNVTKTNGATLLVGVNCPSSEIGLQLLVRNIIVLEGDWTNKPIPQYFEGMKSVGQDDVNGHKIEILSQNKNYFTSNNKFEVIGGVSGKNSIPIYEYVKNMIGKSPQKITFKALVSTENFVNDNHYGLDILFKYTDGSKQWNNFTKGYGLDGLGENETRRKFVWTINTLGRTISDLTNCSIFTKTSSGKIIFEEIEIILSDDNTETYIPHKSNKKEISLNEPLRGLPNGVKDTIEKVNGEWKIVRRCGEYRFDETSKWVGSDVRNNGHWIRVIDSDIPNFKNRGCLITTVEVFGDTVWEDQDLDRLGVWDWSGMNFYIFIPSKLSGWDVANPVDRTTISLFMKTNAINIIYELETQTIEDIDPITLQCWKNGTISIDEVLPVESTHTVALNKSAQIQKNIEELTVLRNRVKALEKQYDNSTLNQAYELELLRLDIELDNIV